MPPTEDEREKLLLEDWFSAKELLPRFPYNAHQEHVAQYGWALVVVLNVLRLVAEGKTQPLQLD